MLGVRERPRARRQLVGMPGFPRNCGGRKSRVPPCLPSKQQEEVVDVIQIQTLRRPLLLRGFGCCKGWCVEAEELVATFLLCLRYDKRMCRFFFEVVDVL